MTSFPPIDAIDRCLGCPASHPPGRSHAVRRSLLYVVSALLFVGCGGDKGSGKPKPPANSPPKIVSIAVFMPRVMTHMHVDAAVTARDADNAELHYFWTANRGSFPSDTTFSSVSWFSPDDPGLDSLTVHVTDLHDTVSASVPIVVHAVDPPSAFAAAAGTSIADLRWTASRDDGGDLWQGYEVYAAARSFESIPPDSVSTYRIAGPIADASYRAFGLTRGKIYYFRVAALRSWEGHEERSPLTPEIDLAPRPEWTKQLQEIRNPAGGGSLDLSAGEVRSLDPTDATGLFAYDLYFGTSDPLDDPGPAANPATPRLKSVSLLANRNADWARNRVRIKRLGSDWGVTSVSDDGWSEEVELESGAVYAVRTPEGCYAKLLVADLSTTVSPYRQLTVKWAYQSIPGYPKF